MYINQTAYCCGLLEIGDFDYNSSKENILQKLKDYYNDEAEYEYTELPFAMFATTSDDQVEAKEALRELKFKATKFKSRHEKSSYKALTHWFRATPPRELLPFLKQLKKDLEEE